MSTTTNASHAGLACALATCLCLSACGGGGGGGGGGGTAFFSGALDPTLGGDGYAVVDLPGTETVTGVAVQPDGKIVVVGTLVGPAGTDMFVVRFNAGGGLDMSFNASGIRLVDFMGGADEALAVALRASDGAIFVVGRTDFLGGSVAIAELTPTGDLEAGFGVAGQVVLDLSIAPDEATAVAVQPDDNVLVAGTVGISSTSNMFVTRLTPSGDFDATWHGNLTGFPEVRHLTWLNKEECHAMALDPITGNVVVAGFTDYTGGLGLDFAVARLLPTGFPDTTFNGTGQTTVDFGGNGDEYATGVQVDLVGRVLVSGDRLRFFDGVTNPVVARLNAVGALDATFHDVAAPTADDGDGRFSYWNHPGPPATDQMAAASLLQHDGRLVIAGFTSMGTTPRNFLASRLTVDGILDGSFANGAGIEGVSYEADEYATAIAQDVAGNLVLAGITRGPLPRVLVMRLTP